MSNVDKLMITKLNVNTTVSIGKNNFFTALNEAKDAINGIQRQFKER